MSDATELDPDARDDQDGAPSPRGHAEQITVKMVGPNARYEYNGFVYHKGQPISVDRATAAYLWGTGRFTCPNLENPDEVLGTKRGGVRIVDNKVRKVLVPEFETKEEARAYAKEKFGVNLPPNTSLNKMAGQIRALAEDAAGSTPTSRPSRPGVDAEGEIDTAAGRAGGVDV